MRLEVNEAAILQLPVKGRDPIGEHARLDGDAQLAHPQIEELLVRPVLPLLWRHHRGFRHPFSLYAAVWAGPSPDDDGAP